MKEHYNFHPAYRPDIDGLRAVAILAVIIFHAFPDSLPGGFVGVDVFFVISGFLISLIMFRSLAHGDFSFREFYAHRVKRIFPALILVMAACFSFGWFSLLPTEYRQLGKHMAASAGFAQNFALWSEAGYFDTTSELKPLMHLWSLGIEEQFYLIFPLLIWVAWRLRFNPMWLVVPLALVSFWLNVRGVQADKVSAFFLPHTRFWELMAGSFLAYQYPVLRERQNDFPLIFRWVLSPQDRGALLNNLLGCTGLSLIVITVFVIDKDTPFPGWWALAPILGTALLIRVGPGAWINRWLLGNRLAVLIGLISYPLYLWHWPLLSFAHIVLNETPSDTIKGAAVALSFPLAWLTYRLIERPVRFGKSTWKKTVALCALTLTVGLAGYQTYRWKGLKSRFPALIAELADYTYDYSIPYRLHTCLLGNKQSYADFGEACFLGSEQNQIKAGTSKSLLLWGDSYAAHLYPGLVAKFGDRLKIAQLTVSACPPVIGFDSKIRPNCKSNNDSILSNIAESQYDIVIIAANWEDHGLVDGLPETLTTLKRMGIKRLILVGPPPNWSKGLPRALFEFSKFDVFHNIPYHMKFGLSQKTAALNKVMAELASSQSIDYLSPWDLLCHDEGCLTRTGDATDYLVACDKGHFTATGSNALFSLFENAGGRID